ncbi:C4-dicarboxylate ABC transporter permease [Deltaproteobacteria bacterium]|nr:C4-dicarboxylate ABC transporter permease [Deltaproteobacteria bacterium]
MHLLQSFNTVVNRILCKILFVSFTCMVILTFMQVVFRYAIAQPLAWSEELARYMFVWATYLGASVAFYENKHINATLFTDFIKSVRVKAGVMVIADILCLAFLAVFVYQGFIVSQRVFNLGQFSPSLPWLPVGIIYLAIPIGCLFMALNVLAYTIRHINSLTTGAALDAFNPDEI